jgi:hypothetical protein
MRDANVMMVDDGYSKDILANPDVFWNPDTLG